MKPCKPLDLLDALVRVVRERPEYVAGLPPEDLTLLVDVFHLPITALNLAILQNPRLVDAFTEDQLQLVVRLSTPQVRAIAHRRLDAIRDTRVQ